MVAISRKENETFFIFLSTKMTEDEPLPLARMATITKASFWIFLVACVALYIYNKAITPDNGDNRLFYINTGYVIIGAAFIGLFLNLITSSIKGSRVNRAFNLACYVFEGIRIVFILTRLVIGH